MSLIMQQGIAPDDPLAVFIMGPTATGKTDLAIALAQELPPPPRLKGRRTG